MGNPDHVKWLQNGVDFWNARRRNKPFNPVLDNEDLTVLLGGSERWDVREISVHLQGINLSGANLRNSTLRDTDLADSSFFKADLHGTKLIGSRLDGSFFVDSNLQNSVLLSASLKNTRFWHCDLESAVLVNARLGNTEFFKCHMKDTHLYHNDLTAARFIGSRPWQARLLWEAGKSQLEPAKLEVDTIKGLDDLLTILRQLREAYDKQQVVLYFRGESRYFDRLEPSIMRKPERGQSPLRGLESQMLNDLQTRQPDAFNGLDSALAQWVMAQHHLLRTRLLDITRNPQVALFFACEKDETEDGRFHVFAVPKSLIEPFNSEEVSVAANFAKLPRAEQNILLGKTKDDSKGDDYPPGAEHPGEAQTVFTRAENHLHSIIRRERPDFQNKIDARDLFRVFVVEPQQMFDRIRAQSGAFLVSAFHERFEQADILEANPDASVYVHHQLKVAQPGKKTMLDDLKLYNIMRETLLPSVDESAKAITDLYLHR